MALLRHVTALLPAQGWESNDETISTRNSCGVYALRAAALGSRDGAGSYGDGGTYYYDAVLWAVANGTSATTFEPDATCTRGQIVTFLYRDIAK